MDIQNIKSQLTITEVLAYYNLQIKKKHVNCPFHEDKTPSMQVFLDSNSVYCYSGNCSKSGKPIDVIDFIMHKEQITKHEAIKKAASFLHQDTKENTIQNTNPLNKTFSILKNQLTRSRNATAYLQTRGLSKLKAVGSNHRSGNDKIQYKYPHLKNCLVFPLKDSKNQIVSFYGRSFKNDIRNTHFYTSNRQGLYPEYPNLETHHLILTESIIDAATLVLHAKLPKHTHVLACYGTNGFTKSHTEAIKQLKQLQIISIFFDGDTAGHKASVKLQSQLQQAFTTLTIQIIDTPKDEDINSLWINNESQELFTHYLQTKIPAAEKQPADNTKPTITLTIKGSVKHLGDSLKVTLQSQIEQKSIIQKLDVYDFTALQKHAKDASKRLELSEDLILKAWQDYVPTLEQTQTKPTTPQKKPLEKATQEQCISFLKDPNLLQRINIAIEKVGVVGEENTRLLLFIIATSYQSKQPLHGLIQGSSGSGKTKLLQSIYNLIPKEDSKSFTRVTESSFYNYNEESLRHKLLCFEDIDGLKEEALLALRELQSNGKLISSTSQKQESGKIQSVERLVKGPIASLSCTTKGDYYEDNISRCFVVAVDETAAQTRKIINYQNQLASGNINLKEATKTKYFIANCLRQLQPCQVVNPYATAIQLPQNIHKLRRLHSMYQVLVAQITYLHQYQRKKDTQGRLITTPQDLQYACDILLDSILLKIDELDGSLRQFYEALKTHFKPKGETYTFNRFEIMQKTKISKTQLHRNLNKLVELEYIQQYGYANRGYTYKIVHWDQYDVLKDKIQKDLQAQINTIKS
ncbi:hypothetical protein A8C32_01710 [Flavivirga aquatica]|uniref:Zinc finger CHC2-type domain-containing protein n=1 Tax=Flavivirga aquatica TaxID=1849968 RepID=A0A1E5TA51_9FLAO|nr:CHC2 zinc finger domain-containing protein [Flavivirga aquatica]OEK08206.1 hypothetical protein A8C32_01710 [Flavivirga aquatica]